jgi:D-alanyl-D-alanine carboxypeptidase/D-alanyl-D-alanine-endopeptidase (penicillin-binding protein 4)
MPARAFILAVVALAAAWPSLLAEPTGEASGAVPAAQPRSGAVARSIAPFGEAMPTPRARAGTALAARRGIGRRQLRRRLARELRRVGGASGAWVADFRAPRRRVLFAKAAGKPRLLASNTKLFTTAAYLARFGPEHQLRTRVWMRGERTGPNGGVLRGSLVLVGDGDPTLNARSFAARHGLPHTSLRPLAHAVKDAGITRVRGQIRADETIFDGKRSVPQAGISGGPYLSPLSGLSFNSGYDGTRYAANPARIAGRHFKRALEAVGVKVSGKVKVARGAPNLRNEPPLAEVESPRALALLAQTNKPSDNFFAEMLLKRLGAKPGARATTRRGAARAERFARSIGSGVSMENGSGLSRRNVASPRQVGKLLVAMHRRRELWPTWRDSLAIAGRDGTLAGRMRGTAAEGRCRGKTGTINGVSALSGYCRAGRGGLVAFSILMNSVDTAAARIAQDRMVAAIARYR